MQHNENVNPPTFFLTLETLIDRMQEEDKMVGSVRRETAGSRIHTVCFFVILITVSYL